MEYTPKKFSTNDLVAAWKDGSLKINEEYQRGASWTQAQMQGLIDSIFRQYPIPPIFLHQIHAKGLGGEESTRYEIVDGQQRIRALGDFHSGKFPLLEASDKRLRLPNSLRNVPAPWGKRRFSELDEKLRNELEKKEIDVFVINELVDADEVRDLFIRLQSGTALTRQQIRDAWPGTVGPFVERLAGKLNRAPAVTLFRQIDRRGTRNDDESDQYDSDRNFCAQLLCLFLARERDPYSQQGIGANDLDKVYHENTTFEVGGESAKRFQDILSKASEVFLAAFAKTTQGGNKRTKLKFRKLDVIATFLLIQDLSHNTQFKFDKSFVHKLAGHILTDREANATGKSTSGPAIAKYYQEWRSKIIEEVGVRLDPKRLFDDSQKEQIFTRDQGKCGVCGELVDRSEAEYDHFPLPHASGGKTAVENARLVHATCHPRGPLQEAVPVGES
ncbi:MAG: GmrSD restriction endonuclease domain-containing protein [Candidatus Acidiferrales bacterium]